MSVFNKIEFLEERIEDPIVRENFEKLRNFINDRIFLSTNFRLIEVKVDKPSNDYEVFHNQISKPKDILITYVSTGLVTINFEKTTKKTISLNVTNPCNIRLLVGSFNL